MGKLGDTSTDIGKCGKFGQITLVLINLLFIVLGIIAMAIGIWALASGSTFAILTGNQIIGGSALLIITGVAVAIIAGLGLFGAMCKNRPLLVIYVIVLLIIIIVEIVAGILAFVYRDTLGNFIQENVEGNLIRNYNASNPSSDTNQIVNFLQGTFSCCGFTNASDWVEFNLDAITTNQGQPPNCPSCVIGPDDENCASFDYPVMAGGVNFTRNFTTTSVGCNDITQNTLLTVVIGTGVVAFIFAVLEIIGVLIGCLLCCCISRAKKQMVV